MMNESAHNQPGGSSQQQQNVGRRLALNACTLCRERKTKCDEARPSCGRCARLKLSCVYVESASGRELIAVSEVYGRLERIEAKLDLLCQGAISTHGVSISRATDSPLKQGQSETEPSLSAVAQRSPSGLNGISSDGEAGLAIPYRHSTTPQRMLLWPCCPVRFHDQDVRYPLSVETCRMNLPSTPIPPKALVSNLPGFHWLDGLSFVQFRCLTASYFMNYHPRCMILDENEFYERNASQALLNGFLPSLNNCLVLLVLAIGSISSVAEGDSSWLPSSQVMSDSISDFEGTGLGFFNLACNIFTECRDVSWLSVQCYLLIAFYRSLQIRVYAQWQAVNQACVTVMLLLQMEPTPTSFQCQLYWIAYLQESQILAELEFPPSGISRLENSIPLPFTGEDEREEAQKVYRLFLLAEIALRRLLNRVHSHLYKLDVTDPPANSPATSLAASPPIMYELDHQLEIWHEHLPELLRFDKSTNIETLISPRGARTPREKMTGTLKSRYFAAKAIIFRPFVYRILHNDGPETLSEEDLAGAKVSMESALQVPVQAGLLCDNLRLVPLILNPARSSFAAAIQYRYISKQTAILSVLPDQWQLIDQISNRLSSEVAPFSPILSKDLEMLGILDGDLSVRSDSTMVDSN
ncbi:hypothetical protein F5884DRAFT_749206 [Xylogone sp. PMI_703]|nr:hypothetical protein F5884DRAFT_749206 [Xylogone sp. PMI_703]